jgi:hypothetical protein
LNGIDTIRASILQEKYPERGSGGANQPFNFTDRETEVQRREITQTAKMLVGGLELNSAFLTQCFLLHPIMEVMF